MTEAFAPDRTLISILKENSFTLSAEVIPPRNGTPQSEVLAQIKSIVEAGAQFLSVTKGAGGSLRGGSLPIAQAIKDHFRVPSIAHFTCRDLTPEECENQLIDHHFFGIRNILALRGDPPTGSKEWVSRSGSHSYAHQLIDQIKKLNSGVFLNRPGLSAKNAQPTEFCIGAAAYPEAESEREQIQYFKMKVEAGAEYGITQMIYSADSYCKFIENLARLKIHLPILPGARILRTKAQAIRMGERFGIRIPKDYYNSLPETEQPEQSLEVFLKYVEELKTAGAPGVHIFVLSDTDLASSALRKLSEFRRHSN